MPRVGNGYRFLKVDVAQAGRDEVALGDSGWALGRHSMRISNDKHGEYSSVHILKSWGIIFDSPLRTLHYNSNGIGS